MVSENNNWNSADLFAARHISLENKNTERLLKQTGLDSLDQLVQETLPASIRLPEPLSLEGLPEGKSEWQYIRDLRKTASLNKVFRSYIGLGYFPSITPPVIQRNILENPGWYTQYTPYQAEIAQGRLQALLNFQTMVIDLTGMEIANASLLDEATAAAEAMHLLYNTRAKDTAHCFYIAGSVYPQTREVLTGYAAPLGITLRFGAEGQNLAELSNGDFNPAEIFGVLIQYPATDGLVASYSAFAADLKSKEIGLAVAADLMSLVVLEAPGSWGADIVVGSTQRFGVPLGFGGPHAAFFATRDELKRHIPGRIIGVSIDSHGNEALRMALQTREQHIKRDKATSNICTAQALLAIMASMYAVWHGPAGLTHIARRIHANAVLLAAMLEKMGYKLRHDTFFDTLCIDFEGREELTASIRASAIDAEINFRYNGSAILIALDETVFEEDVIEIARLFARIKAYPRENLAAEVREISRQINPAFADGLARTTAFLSHRVFNSCHTEHEMLRYIKRLEARDLSLTHSMIALGSCTMKLNATTEMLPVTWPEFADLHPFAPAEQTAGYLKLFSELESWLCSITGFAAFSLQPNSGAQGEYAGLRVIRAFLAHKGEAHRDLVLIPSSAHGTNPASAVIAGFRVLVVACDSRGNIDVADLQKKAVENQEQLAALMVTYPSTHGVFEESIVEICEIIHAHGGQVYMDGANMNAQVGLTSPGFIGADVCHLNLHKTFCIPHGGGGPGMGPIGVAAHLKPFLPGHRLIGSGTENSIEAVSAAPWGSAGVLVISHAYISLMGAQGLTDATRHAILNANYIKTRLEKYYPVLYAGKNGRCAHELILDCRSFKPAGIEVADIAKRLMDYGYHAPTVSFPVSGTLMIEPTESESVEELDRFCEALIHIRSEIEEIQSGRANPLDNLLRNAPHTAAHLLSESWSHPYSRETAGFPLSWVRDYKFWPSVGRLNETHGDRNFICSCPPVEAYAEQEMPIMS